MNGATCFRIGKSELAGFGYKMSKERPNAEIIEGMAVRRNVKGQQPYYATFHDLKNNKLVGMEEGGYKLVEKDGKLIETTRNIDINQPFYEYRAVSDAKTGKVESLTENRSYPAPIVTLTENKNGDIVASKKSKLEALFEEPENAKQNADAINEVRKYRGEGEISPSQLYCETAHAILKPFAN